MRVKISVSWVICFFCLVANIRGQGLIDADIIEAIQKQATRLLSEADTDFSNNAVPAKWKDESAVVLGFKRVISLDKQGRFLSKNKNLEILEKRRLRIALLDGNAVKKFSTLFFRFSSKQDGFVVRIIKPDGSIYIVPLNNAVSIEDSDEVPEFFKSTLDPSISNRSEYYKVPVSNLQAGDLLEYVSVTANKFTAKYHQRWVFFEGSSVYQFENQYEICNKAYPIVLNKLVIETDKDFFLTSRSLRGAPDFVLTKNEDGDDVFTWTDKDRESIRDVNFLSEFIEMPTVKYSLTYAKNYTPKDLFIGEAGQLKTSFDETEMCEKLHSIYKKSRRKTFTHYPVPYSIEGPFVFSAYSASLDVWNEMRGSDEDELEGTAYLYAAYNRLCHNALIAESNDLFFVRVLAELLEKKDIPCDILVTTPKSFTAIGDIVSEDEITWLVRAKNQYIFKPNPSSYVGDIHPEYTGNTAYKIAEGSDVIKVTLPAFTSIQNASKMDLLVTFNPAEEKYTILKTTAEKGIYSIFARKNLSPLAAWWVYYYFPCTNDAEKIISIVKSKKNIPSPYAKLMLEPYYAQKTAAASKIQKADLEKMYLADITYDSLYFTNYGNCQTDPAFTFTERFNFKRMQRKAGKKILFDLPSIIGSQIHITDEEREQRQYDANVGFPRQLVYTIRFVVPQGYTLEGLNRLETNIENEMGNFICTTVTHTDTVQIDIVKTYKTQHIPRAMWQKVLSFTDAAYNFTQKLVLLRPKE